MRPAQRDRLREDLAGLSPGAVTWRENPDRIPLDLATRFDGKPVWLEIGFGSGEHMVHQALANPDVAIIGAEPYLKGVATLLGGIRRENTRNISVFPGDARDLLDVLPEASISRIFLLYPDPWPKARHHRRRFVSPEFLIPLARALKPGGVLRVATDIPDYVRQTLAEVPKAGLDWLAECSDDWRRPWEDWLPTRYERKARREGRTPHYLTFRLPD